MVKRLVVTAGEPAGIGPDLVLALSKEHWPHQLVVCADKKNARPTCRAIGD